MSRSQSGTRVATTASPVSGAHLFEPKSPAPSGPPAPAPPQRSETLTSSLFTASRGSSLGKEDAAQFSRLFDALAAVEKLEASQKGNRDILDENLFPSITTSRPVKSFLIIDSPGLLAPEELGEKDFMEYLEKLLSRQPGARIIVTGITSRESLEGLNALIPLPYRFRIQFTQDSTEQVTASLARRFQSAQANIAVLHAGGNSAGFFSRLGENIFEVRYDSEDPVMAKTAVKRFAIQITGKIALYGEEAVKALREKEGLSLLFEEPRVMRLNRSNLLELIEILLAAAQLSRRTLEKAA
jgi:hypothetical protein